MYDYLDLELRPDLAVSGFLDYALRGGQDENSFPDGELKVRRECLRMIVE